MTGTAERIKKLTDAIVRINPLQRAFIEESLIDVRDHELRDLDAYIRFAEAAGIESDYLAESYDLIVKDTLREQMYFQRHGCYRYSTFDEVAGSVYFNEEYMRKYMHGLAITAYLWPNHRALHRYFIDVIPTDKDGRYLEIGPGHGVFMMCAMRKTAFSRFEGVDISPTSVEMTRSLLGSGLFGDFASWEIIEQDFFASDMEDGGYSAVVMGEVLEHVEDPGQFLRQINTVATDDAFIFITTPVNAPAIDHIYLFDSVESIEALVSDAGLTVRDSLLVPYPGLSVEESTAQKLPVNVAMVLGK
jgi:2-polyprenyl-3-methyl-5-hydroxy-6-metoxy-1,4-benzoquinol methylase